MVMKYYILLVRKYYTDSFCYILCASILLCAHFATKSSRSFQYIQRDGPWDNKPCWIWWAKLKAFIWDSFLRVYRAPFKVLCRVQKVAERGGGGQKNEYNYRISSHFLLMCVSVIVHLLSFVPSCVCVCLSLSLSPQFVLLQYTLPISCT